MPLPLFLGIAAGIAAVGGIGTGIRGGVKMKEANDTMKAAERINNRSIREFESLNESTTKKMDELGKFELEILQSFKKFSDIFEKIKNRPEFKEVNIEGATIPKYDAKKIKEVSVGAATLISGLSGAALGTAGGFAAAGCTTAAVMALGTASTGTAIASLSGAAATNATLAALGGGAIAAGGGGVAVGTAVLGASTLGVGLLVGGIIFSIAGSSTSKKAEEAMDQARENRAKADKVCDYLRQLTSAAESFSNTLESLNNVYKKHLDWLDLLVNVSGKTDYRLYNSNEKVFLKNTVSLVSLLYKTCQVKLVFKSDNEDDLNKINYEEINDTNKDVNNVLKEIASEKPIF